MESKESVNVKSGKGRLQIQSDGAEIFYRRFDLTLLSADTLFVPEGCKQLFKGKNLSGWKLNGTEKWYVDDGELVCESGPDKKYGYL